VNLGAEPRLSPDQFRGKTVVVVGLRSTAGDIIPDLMPLARKVYSSHRRGAIPFKRYNKGTPNDFQITWRRRQLSFFLQKHFPNFARVASDKAVDFLGKRMFGPLDPAWRLTPFPSVTLNLPGSFELAMPFFKNGQLTSLHGIRRFLGPRSVEFEDGTVLNDIDALVLCTGYDADWTLADTFVSKSSPRDTGSKLGWYQGPEMYRLYMNLFPTAYASSCVCLCYSAYGKSNGFSFADVTSMAVSNVWRGVEQLPTQAAMEAHIDNHQAWVARRWRVEPLCDVSAVKQFEFQTWLHCAAGTGMESLGWGWKGWKFWWEDAKMYRLMNDGVETAHAYRYFETGKRKTWEGAREAILHVNEAVKIFPLKVVDWPPETTE
jgi:dimethylaniline monooxygenase (N-oxide forming)